MKKPVLSIDEPAPKRPLRADRPPTEGFVTIVDGHFKSEFDSVDAAETSSRKLKAAYPQSSRTLRLEAGRLEVVSPARARQLREQVFSSFDPFAIDRRDN